MRFIPDNAWFGTPDPRHGRQQCRYTRRTWQLLFRQRARDPKLDPAGIPLLKLQSRREAGDPVNVDLELARLQLLSMKRHRADQMARLIENKSWRRRFVRMFEFGSRSSIPIPSVADESSSAWRDGDQDGVLCTAIASICRTADRTIRREYLDQTLFWTAADLETKLLEFKNYYNEHRAHAGICGKTPGDSGVTVCANLQFYRWREHCHALFQTPMAA